MKNTKALTFGIIGFLLGGLVVSVAATQFDNNKKDGSSSELSMSAMTDDLAGKKGDDFDKAFISHMIEHHQSAVDMAKLAEKNAKHTEIKELSKAIIAAQESEIADMRQWQMDWGYRGTTMEHSSH